MHSRPSLVGCFLWVVLICVPATLLADTSPDRPAPVSLRGLSETIESLVQKIAKLEARVAQLEAKLRKSRIGKPDKHGILRDVDGRVIGLWGIETGQEVRLAR